MPVPLFLIFLGGCSCRKSDRGTHALVHVQIRTETNRYRQPSVYSVFYDEIDENQNARRYWDFMSKEWSLEYLQDTGVARALVSNAQISRRRAPDPSEARYNASRLEELEELSAVRLRQTNESPSDANSDRSDQNSSACADQASHRATWQATHLCVLRAILDRLKYHSTLCPDLS